MDHGKLHQLEAKLAHLEAERTLLLARLAALEGPASRPDRRLERLHALLSAVWLDLQEIRPRRVPEMEEALRILEGLLCPG